MSLEEAGYPANPRSMLRCVAEKTPSLCAPGKKHCHPRKQPAQCSTAGANSRSLQNRKGESGATKKPIEKKSPSARSGGGLGLQDSYSHCSTQCTCAFVLSERPPNPQLTVGSPNLPRTPVRAGVPGHGFVEGSKVRHLTESAQVHKTPI